MIPGSYDRCLRGIKLLKERNLPLKLKTVATSINKHEIGDAAVCGRRTGSRVQVRWANQSRIDCSQSPLAVRLTPEEVVALDMPLRKE
jgi:hypothetical protein